MHTKHILLWTRSAYYYFTVFASPIFTGGLALQEHVHIGFRSLGSTRTSPWGPLNMVPQQISSRRHIDRSINGSLLFVEEVRDGNRKEVCEAVETWWTGCVHVVTEPDENSSDTSLGLGLGEPHIKVGDKSPLSVSISSSSVDFNARNRYLTWLLSTTIKQKSQVINKSSYLISLYIPRGPCLILIIDRQALLKATT